MGAVDIGIGHDDDLVVAELADIKVVVDASSEGRDHSLDLFVGIDPVLAGLLHVEDLAAQGQDGLSRAAPGGLGAAACGIALDQEDLAVFGILVGAVRQLAGQAQGIQGCLAAGEVPGLSGRLSGPLGQNGLLAYLLCDGWILFQEPGQLLGHDAVRGAAGLGIAQLLLGLALKLGILDLDTDDGRDSFADILAGQVLVAVLEDLVFAGVFVEGLGHRIAETDQVHAALGGIDIIDEAVFAVGVGVVVLHGDFHIDIVFGALEIHDRIVEGFFVVVEVGDELPDPALVVEGLVLGAVDVILALIPQGDAQAPGQESHLPHPLAQDVVFKNGRLCENERIRQEGDRRSRLFRGAGPDLFERHGRIAPGKALVIDLSALADLHIQPFGKGIDDRGADTVQAAGHLVSAAAEFSAGVELGKDQVDCVASGLVVDADRDPAPVVRDRDGIVRMDGHRDLRAEAGQGLIDRVVHDLIDQVVESSGGCGPDIHARTFADSLESLEHLDIVRRVIADLGRILDIVVRILPVILLILHGIGTFIVILSASRQQVGGKLHLILIRAQNDLFFFIFLLFCHSCLSVLSLCSIGHKLLFMILVYFPGLSQWGKPPLL